MKTCRFGCQHISTLFHVLLKADPGLEGDVADGKADSSVCHQLGQVSVLQEEPPNSWWYVFECLSIVVVYFLLVDKAGATGKGDKWLKGPRAIWQSCPPPPPGCPAYPPHPSSFPPSPPHDHHPPSFPCQRPTSPPSGVLEVLQALPPILQGPIGQRAQMLCSSLNVDGLLTSP